jgi:hypothetical protein
MTGAPGKSTIASLAYIAEIVAASARVSASAYFVFIESIAWRASLALGAVAAGAAEAVAVLLLSVAALVPLFAHPASATTPTSMALIPYRMWCSV